MIQYLRKLIGRGTKRAQASLANDLELDFEPRFGASVPNERETQSTRDDAIRMRVEITKSRPLSLEQRYERLADSPVVAQSFADLKRYLFKQINEINADPKSAGRFLKETGRVDDGRPYFFIQPLNRAGWLFEQTSTGWVVAKAMKNVANKSFLRGYDQWDVVSVFQAADGNVRVNAPRLDQKLCSAYVYRQIIASTLLLNDSTEPSR